MSGFYYIKIANGLLEPKHCQAMGEAVWLYMWLQDKCTSVNENEEGKVLGNRPIVYDDDIKPALGCSRRTYVRWIEKLETADYIKTLRTPRGLSIIITKAKKYTTEPKKGSAKSAHHQRSNSDVPKANITKSDAPQTVSDAPHSPTDAPNLHMQYKTIQRLHKTINNSTDVELGDKKSPAKNPHKEMVSKIYYEAVKALDLPVRNHNNLKSKINEMARDKEQDKIINYLKFMRDQFAGVEWDYKPHISEALDIFNKRGVIRDTFAKHVRTEQNPNVWRPKGKVKK